MAHSVICFGKYFLCTCEEWVTAAVGWNVLRMSSKSSWLLVLFKSSVSAGFLSPCLSLTESGVAVSD